MKTKYRDYDFTYTLFKVQSCMGHVKPELFSHVHQELDMRSHLSFSFSAWLDSYLRYLCVYLYISELYVQLCDTFPLTTFCH